MLVVGVLVPLVPAASSARPPHYQLRADDRVRLAEANRLRYAVENRVWPSWAATPFAVLLVTDSVEFLFWHSHPSAEFTAQGYDSVLHTEVFARPRRFATNLLATFPAVGPTPTIVIGQPANAGKSSSEWVLTLLHEHFHQLQFSRAGYYTALDTLGLARGDQSGMWMLNYPFPYDSLRIRRLTGAASTALADALDASASSTKDVLARSLAEYKDLRAALSLNDRRYLEFQLWQEGVARYVEYTCALVAAQAEPSSAEFVALPDYVPYAEVATRLFAGIMEGLRHPDLRANRRTTFYALGAALALLLDRTTPDWKDRYFSAMFTLQPHFGGVRPPVH
jgi:hypothetical protein